MTRDEKQRTICRRVSARIDEVTPEGLGRWDQALEIVREPSDDFLDALDDFLDDDSPGTRAALQEAADELVRAWREAGRRYEEHADEREGVPA